MIGWTLLVVSGAAFAADAFDTHAASIEILQLKPVQNEIKLTEAQRTKMNKFAETHRSQMVAYQNRLKAQAEKNPQVRPDQSVIQRYYQQLKKSVLASLSATQLRRLREISLQSAGVGALMDDKVSARVGLSSAQLKKIRDTFLDGNKRAQAIQTTAAKPIVDKYRGKKPKNNAEAQKLETAFRTEMQGASTKIAPQMRKLQADTANKMMAVLTAAQKQSFQALKGKPFTPPKTS